MGRIATGLALMVLGALWHSPAAADKRVALVIGNSGYQHVARLDNPKHDATLMADTLHAIGFDLVGGRAQLDLDKPALDSAIQAFGRQSEGADVALFYYAGHGVQVGGANYLVPIAANPVREADVDFQMVDVNVLLRQMQGAGTRLKIVVLDACRNNPFGARGLRAGGGGLAQMRAPDGTLISYATQPGSVALDGADGHSPYTRALSATVRRVGLDIFQTFNQVGLAVMRATAGAQQPWVSSSPIDGTFYFVAPQPAGTAATEEARLSEPRSDRDRTPLTGAVELRELRERLYELNFDPDQPDPGNGLRRAISQYQQKAELPQTGEATEGLLERLRQTVDLRPWGSIVYDPDKEKWGISWNHRSRKAAVTDARSNCGSAPCAVELSFYGSRCGAFAVSRDSWALLDRESLQLAKDAALSSCAKSGKGCRIIGAVCADGSGR
ncbi:putative peptidoglycan binding protein [Rhodopseudomonas thermotolerans]|uniref:Peptidoglycan binding protein n=2 Tax=Rhodopseudomonas TaxID=1073 RepID=A0A336JRQ7_9BRAD|nr:MULTISPECIES: caspase family protein [Rhodopseudomonas]RED37814.1 putative peptidoglycan binding protein [Rhodopseudomonas pentothenatexigens]REG04548.1 putative peptidoglycan binding protein [Rhodopseudomonas thermotolerans]SSW90314.1 putative peptidoglycan binding protein [Rhodopseudomonas pentothenatexigens]